jgi:hypothetical protein
MTAPRVRCAAAGLFRDKHQATGSRWVVTSPSGETYDLCSAFCLLEFATIGALPADITERTPMYAENPHVRSGEADSQGSLVRIAKVPATLAIAGTTR